MDQVERLSPSWLARLLAVASVFSMALLAFRLGVDVSDRPGLPAAGLLAQVYYSAGLFFLGGLDLGTPQGGPQQIRALLWTAYFVAPIITTSAVIEGALRLVGARVFDRVGLRDHLLVVGLGRLGRTFVRAMRSYDDRRVILAVDKDTGSAAIRQVKHEHRVRLVPGEARIEGVFSTLAVEAASGIALLTEDDLLNLNTAFRLAAEHPRLRIVAHVSNMALQRAAIDICAETNNPHLVVFNGHRTIAQHLYEHHLAPYFEKTPGRDTVVLGGFGRFGQTILELLQAQASAELDKLLIIDRTAGLSYRSFEVQVGEKTSPTPTTIDGDLTDPHIWGRIRDELGDRDEDPVILIAADHDSVNLQSALSARAYWPRARVFVRFQTHSVLAQRLASRHRFTVLGVDSTLIHALSATLPGWFPKAR